MILYLTMLITFPHSVHKLNPQKEQKLFLCYNTRRLAKNYNRLKELLYELETGPKIRVHNNCPRQTDREQRRLAKKGDPKYIFTIPRAILPKPLLCDEITVTKSSLRGQFVAVS